MEIEKFFENYSQPKVCYSKFKEKNKIIFKELYSDIQTIKFNKFKKLKLCLYSIVLLLVLSFGMIYIMDFPNPGAVENGTKLSEIERNEFINYLSSENVNNNFILERNSVELIKDDNVSMYEINYQVDNPYYICGYVPCTNQEILIYYRNIMKLYQHHVLKYDVALDIFKQSIEKEYPQFLIDNNFDFDSIEWIKYNDIENINEIKDDLGLVFIYKVSYVLVKTDKLDNTMINKELKCYSECDIIVEEDLLLKDNEFLTEGLYIIFGNKNILQSNKSSFNDFYSYTKDEYSEFQTYIRIIEENDNFYLIEQTNKISTKGEKIDILLDKYSVYKEHFESCIIETNQQGDNLFAIYDVEKYINIFKTIKEK